MVELADKLFDKLSERDKKLCILGIKNLFGLIDSGHGLSNHMIFIIDNNMLIALEKPTRGSNQIFYCALVFTFRALANLNVRYQILITPAIFWEFSHKKTLTHEYELNKQFYLLNEILKVLRIQSNVSSTIKNFMSYCEVIGKIKSDMYLINNILKQLKAFDFSKWVNDSPHTPVIINIAHNYIKKNINENDLNYFSIKQVALYLTAQLHEMMLDAIEDEEDKRLNTDSSGIMKSRTKVIEFKNAAIKGYGDMELLSLCDIGMQFHYQLKNVVVGLTFDEDLASLLISHSATVIEASLHGGIDTQQSANLKFNDFLAKRRKSDNQFLIRHKLWKEFDDEIKKISCLKPFWDDEKKYVEQHS